MGKHILTKEQIYELVSANCYPVNEQNKFLSRCIDGRYANSEDLPPLAIPGADAGELAIIFATANSFGFEIDQDKTFATLVEVVGGIKNLQLHTDSHADKAMILAGCGHIKQMTLDPQAYNIEKEQLDFIKEKLINAKKAGAKETVLYGEHMEGAVLQVKGNCSIMPSYKITTDHGKIETEVFVFHGSLVDARHRELSRRLIANQAVKLLGGLDAEYLYQALSDVSENHLLETAKRLAKGLPIYLVQFDQKGGFEIEEMGIV